MNGDSFFNFPNSVWDFLTANSVNSVWEIRSLYEDGQKKLEAEVIRLRREIDEQETKHEEFERFIEKAKAYVGIRKLDGYILHELVKAIYVESPRRVDGKKEQRIHIEYNGIGFIPIYDLIEQETA